MLSPIELPIRAGYLPNGLPLPLGGGFFALFFGGNGALATGFSLFPPLAGYGGLPFAAPGGVFPLPGFAAGFPGLAFAAMLILPILDVA